MGTCHSQNVKKSISTKSKLLILVIGGPCSGKSSISQHLSTHFQLSVISPDHLIRECVDQENLQKPEVRMEHLHRRRLRTYNALLIHNRMTKEEKEFLGKVGEPLGVTMSRNHFSLHRQSDSEEDDCLYCPPHVRDIQNALKHGEPIDPECISTLIHNAMQACIRNCNGFIIDGYPRDSTQAIKLSEKIGDPHIIVFLECPENVMIDRALARAQASQRYDENEPFLKLKIMNFSRNLAHLTQHWALNKLLILNANGNDPLESLKDECVALVQARIESDHFRFKFRDSRRSRAVVEIQKQKQSVDHKKSSEDHMARSLSK